MGSRDVPSAPRWEPRQQQPVAAGRELALELTVLTARDAKEPSPLWDDEGRGTAGNRPEKVEKEAVVNHVAGRVRKSCPLEPEALDDHRLGSQIRRQGCPIVVERRMAAHGGVEFE
jgi:hypothetical protein